MIAPMNVCVRILIGRANKLLLNVGAHVLNHTPRTQETRISQKSQTVAIIYWLYPKGDETSTTYKNKTEATKEFPFPFRANC